ncbi:MAG: hypothetical protein IKM74_03800 [Bacteroidales bacterium]|nr:hypothetical protein [Bacteroidales bacterium]
MNMFSMAVIGSKKELEALISNTYFSSLAFAVVAILIALVIATLIKWQGHPDNSYKTRRAWWIIIGVVFPIAFWAINYFYVGKYIEKASWSADFMKANIFAALIGLGLYFVVSIITMLIVRSSKWGSILGKTKNK